MLWHDDIAEQREIVAVADFPQNFQEEIAAMFGSEEREPSITTEGDEVEVAEAVAAL